MALVALLASINYVAGLDHPSQPIWDESYYLTSTQRYADGTAQFASHPPLGLMLIAAGDAIVGANRGLHTSALARDKEVRGQELPEGYSFAGVRLASGVFAVVGAIVFFVLLLELTQRRIVALLISNLYVFDNALVAHFRAAHLDAFQIAFALCALLCFVISAKRQEKSSPWIEFALGVSCGLAAMVKLNAALLTILGVMLVARRVCIGWRSRPLLAQLVSATREGVVMLAGCLLAIVAVFAIHVAISPHPPDPATAAGRKDDRFVSATYRAYLNRERPLTASVVLAAMRDYASFMAADFDGMTRADPNTSSPPQWLLNTKTINYRWDSDGIRTSYVQLTGNPVGWTLALVVPIAAVWLVILQWSRPRASTHPYRRDVMAMLLLLYAGFMIVHGYLATLRVMYLYHYFPALLLAFCLLPLVMREAADRWRVLRARQVSLFAGATALLLAGFVFYSPLTFHRAMTHGECELRNILQRVVVCQA